MSATQNNISQDIMYTPIGLLQITASDHATLGVKHIDSTADAPSDPTYAYRPETDINAIITR